MSDGHLIHIVKNMPEESPILHVHLLHGMAEHIERYDEFAQFLVGNGIIVSGHDHRGHGKTAEKNGRLGFLADQDGFERIVEDAREVLMHVREDIEDVPLILFGHSMGSFVARRYMQKYSESLSKVILSGTAFNPGIMGDIGTVIGKIASKQKTPQTESALLNELSFGGFNKQFEDTKTDFDWLSSDANEVKKYIDDPYCGFIPSNQFYIDLFYGLKIIHNKSELTKIRKDLPILLISGLEDPIGKTGKDIFKVAKGMTNVGMENVMVQLIENARHEILNEVNKHDTYQFIENWMLKDV
ncbi:alpha/beta fold hydrolase [Psychrobacillus sp. OK032]|uniref:alpha/beta fold hydrolase n=1 Tax=Psychrobacillus sp. OK032 TaxID=1884358 RepID=UPI0008C74F16|nr:alpha/beta fold hydrolase [Psychrobacillus sp. OK032]SES35466.1 Lysophospholipase, alpha-beta hydrolase superfamily [Psychrobacillus sp. OK032]